MFTGEFKYSIDSKGRVVFPPRFREELGTTFYATKGMENTIFIYTNNEWEILAEKIGRLKQLSMKEARSFARLFFAGASPCELDKQGRLSIPQNLRQYAQLDKEVYIIGVAKRIEIWDKEKWEAFNEDESSNYDSITEKLQDLEI
ncbi:division/cell wall cluster transcriptional repressor MraZ [Citroniella saccharovorans]|uniref:Transcriptional regulator MraZ n=1 Tax=Citroniella saccharovorans TaxID=2053367 RepID=A0AAW9MZ36_9FIRM|nr:division/cell wall cluster transcriptional repressor MraZ [Citroniella saccharovorans]MEB3429855.1 division/cell wall cluster transcriptional repressor MraZ [Citroniella saccharovorans]